MTEQNESHSLSFYLGILGGVSLGALLAYFVALVVRQRLTALRTQPAFAEPEREIVLEIVPSPAAEIAPVNTAPVETAPVETAPDIPEQRAAPALAADDLAVLEGVGPKTASVLQAAGLRTFAAVASETPTELRAILDAAGLPKMINPATWPEQAALAARGEWDALAELQNTLKAGRR